jgi:SPX domain protein involved in polyphosphate accumulation
MRFGLNFNHFAIPEWKDCYIDYLLLKKFVKLIALVTEKIALFKK